ncbi:MAG: retroviral-like aspartic protease family protein [Bacteroidales bacterium]|nr:retroviral-like aspartic protease family protein [Candidatus Scybalousia scybalohippi]
MQSVVFRLGENLQKIVIPIKIVSKVDGNLVAFSCKALVDSGAESCLISSNAANEIGLQVVGESNMRGCTGRAKAKIYNASLSFSDTFNFNNIDFFESQVFDNTNFDIVIGMSVLSQCSFSYNKKENAFVLQCD